MRVPLPPNYKPKANEEILDKTEVWLWISLPFFFVILLVSLYFMG